MDSPYNGLPPSEWKKRTLELIEEHPLDPNEIYEVVVKVWDEIFKSRIGRKPFRIGIDLFPRPQIMGYFLHELIPLEFAYRYPGIWRREETTNEKDLVYIPDPYYSIEIKTSSDARQIFGNRSYAQLNVNSSKRKFGYYLAVNFGKFESGQSNKKPHIKLVRFGWIDHEDWIPQKSESGQQAHLAVDTKKYKLLKLPLD